MVRMPPLPPPLPDDQPERLLVYNPAIVTLDAALARATLLGCPSIITGLPPWMVERGYSFGGDGYVAVLICRVPEHNAVREVLAILKDANLTPQAVAAVFNHDLPGPVLDRDTKIRNIDLASVTDPATRQVLQQLKDALTG